ncbi:MAG: substrate-binding domain-containing protein [Spirochaetaceae bacterium]|nr:substrate-binding domain-containing protein [Spirochaetaceae bacterium]
MKKNAPALFLFQRIAAGVAVFFAACSARFPAGGRAAGAPTAAEILTAVMPAAMADGYVKVAMVRNLAAGDHTRQFLEGAAAEGRALGFTVDTFFTGGDDEKCRQLIARISRADYDGLILSHGGAGFTGETLRPAVERGVQVVTFDALPFRDSAGAEQLLPGVTSTAQNDERLALLSLDALIEHFGGRRVKVIRIFPGPGIAPLDRRQEVYDAYVRQGRIEEAALVIPRDFAFARSGVREALAAALNRFPPGTVDAIWAPYDEFAKGCVDALAGAGRKDIVLASIDISNDDIRLMLDHADIWLAAAALDPAAGGAVNMRILAAKFAGAATPERWIFDVYLVRTADLDQTSNMGNIAEVLPLWGAAAGLFDGYPWMAALRGAPPEKAAFSAGRAAR